MKVECWEPGNSPVTLEDVKKHLRITGDEFDESLHGLLEAATDAAENFTGLKLRAENYSVICDYSREIATGLLPIRSVEVKVDGETVEGAVVNGSKVLLPVVPGSTVEMTVRTGYLLLPHAIRAAILLMTGKLFDNPSDSVENLPKASTNLLKHYRRWER